MKGRDEVGDKEGRKRGVELRRREIVGKKVSEKERTGEDGVQ